MVVETNIVYTLHDDEEVNWYEAQSRCQAGGQRLAVLDTVEKLTTLKQQLRIKHNFPTAGY